jgi:hypothetical protein
VQAISPQINVEANEIIADKSIAVVDQGVGTGGNISTGGSKKSTKSRDLSM